VNEIVRDWCGSLTREEVLQRCYATDTPAGPAQQHRRHLRRPAVPRAAQPGGHRRCPHRRGHDRAGAGAALSETPGSIRSLGPTLGQHTDEVLRECWGLDEAEIADAAREAGDLT
jgi:crotonobetainyl-CoA:carnitine CoA-transferase CaiB-like acyl-CoA transferase